MIAYVIGDYIEDIYQPVRVVKIAPDAPAPVWELDGPPIKVPGGAGNVAEQFRFLAEETVLASSGWLTRITPGARLRTLSGTDGAWPNRKTRYVQNGHILARLDDPRGGWDDPEKQRLCTGRVLEDVAVDLEFRGIKDGRAGDVPVVAVLSDYAQGFWNPTAAVEAVALFREFGVPTVLDPKPAGVPLLSWKGVTVVKLNESEASRYGSDVFRLDCAVVGTHGGLPPTFFVPSCPPNNIGRDFTTDRPLWASGAGDCFAAYLAAGIPAHGGRVTANAVEHAHAAAAAYTRKLYNAPVHPREADEITDIPNCKLYTEVAELRSRLAALPPGSRVGFTNGCFDLLHAGHVYCLSFARRHCDFLIVAVNSDTSAHRLKGKPPVLTCAERAAALAGLASVSAVIGFDTATPCGILEALPRMSVLVKGGECAGREVPGSAFADRVLFSPSYPGLHTTDILQRIHQRN